MIGGLSGNVRAATGLLIRYVPLDPAISRTGTETLRQVLLSGASVTAPFIVTVLVLGIVLDFVAGVLAPFARALTVLGVTGGAGGVIAQAFVVAVLFGVVFLAGVLVESGPISGVGRGIGRAVEAVPGVGSVYSSFDRMSDAMLERDSQSFKEVKLVEFPHADIYSLAFQTAEITAADGDGGTEELLVLFVPLAPNPVMGGFLICVPDHRIREVDLTVQEAFQAIITSGVAMTGADDA